MNILENLKTKEIIEIILNWVHNLYFFQVFSVPLYFKYISTILPLKEWYKKPEKIIKIFINCLIVPFFLYDFKNKSFLKDKEALIVYLFIAVISTIYALINFYYKKFFEKTDTNYYDCYDWRE